MRWGIFVGPCHNRGMSNEDGLDAFFRDLEQHYGRTISPAARQARIAKQIEASRQRREATAWMQRLVERQGTIMPDFNSLYDKKAAIDRKLLGENEP